MCVCVSYVCLCIIQHCYRYFPFVWSQQMYWFAKIRFISLIASGTHSDNIGKFPRMIHVLSGFLVGKFHLVYNFVLGRKYNFSLRFP